MYLVTVQAYCALTSPAPVEDGAASWLSAGWESAVILALSRSFCGGFLPLYLYEVSEPWADTEPFALEAPPIGE